VNRTLRRMLVAVTAASLLVPTAAVADDSGTQTAPPTATAARTGPPASVGVLGDSISAGTGADGRTLFDSLVPLPGSTRPERSWATGNDVSSLQSVFQRTRALRPGQTTTRANLAVNGARSRDILGQVQGSPVNLGYILIQIGGNDLCRPTVDQMTPLEEYRDNIDAALRWIDEHRPDAIVQINSVPDIWRLWDLRRTNATAVTFWSAGLIPCQSLLSNPTSFAEEDVARRAQVREHGLAYNDELRDVCEQYLRCRYDDDATWLFSNDPSGFVNSDISNQDHFHPSYAGQVKLARVSWENGFDFRDATAPTVSFDVGPASNDAGWHRDAVDVTVTATDDVEVAGIETRVHAPDGTVGRWTVIATHEATVAVSDEGSSYVEARAIDINGNVSASDFQAVSIDATDPTIDLEFPLEDGAEVVLGSEGLTVNYTCDDDRSGIVSCTGTQDTGEELDTSTVGLHTFTVDALDAAGNTAQETIDYRVVYTMSAAADRVDVDEPVEIMPTAVLPVRVSLTDAAGDQVTGLSPALSLENAAGVRTAAGALRYDAVEDRYTAQVSLRRLGVSAGAYDLIAVLDDGTERTIVSLIVR
jgi:lysophospholipase L1-like esterase